MPPHEIVVCDDGSDDKTVDIINQFINETEGTVISLYQNPATLRVVNNFAKALSLATGDIIFLSDQDDVWMPDKVEKMTSYFQSHPTIHVLFSNAILINEANVAFTAKTLFDTVNFTATTQAWFQQGFGFELLNQANKVTGATLALRKTYATTLLPFPVLSVILHDEFIAVNAVLDECLFFLNECLIAYRIHPLQQNGLGIWIEKPPVLNPLTSQEINPDYFHITHFLTYPRVAFYAQRRQNCKSWLGIFRIIRAFPLYKKFYHRYGYRAIGWDLLHYCTWKIKHSIRWQMYR
jgi:glycosyltransferase involved in cell wall biosynthesis